MLCTAALRSSFNNGCFLTRKAGGFSGGPNGASNRGGGSARGSWGGSGSSRGGSHAKVTYASSAPSTSSSSTEATSSRGRGGGRGGRGGRGGGARTGNSSSDGAAHHGVHLPSPDDCPRVVDIGANLNHRQFSRDLPQLLERARARKVTPIVVTGTSVRSSEQAIELCAKYPDLLYSTVGVHPHDAKSCGEGTIARLRTLASNACVVSLGECGLDFDRNFSEPAVQEKWFAEQLKLAAELKKPVFLHERSAHERFVAILEEHRDIIDLSTCVVHCFTGNTAEVKKYLQMGMYIGITGWVTNKEKGVDLRAAVKHIPLDRIMIETDAPFIAPRNAVAEDGSRVRVERNEPELLHLVLPELAACMGVSVDDLAKASTENAHKFFRIPTPSS